MLNELDKELEKRGHRFVRYADDLIILMQEQTECRENAGEHRSVHREKLFLRVNREKTTVAYISRIKFLGYSFYVYKGEGRLRVHPNSIAKMKEQIKMLTSRSNGWGYARRKEALRQYITGWVNYFKLADMRKLL